MDPIDPIRKLGDGNYRWYNCNLQAPKIKTSAIDTDILNYTHIGLNGPRVYSGYKSMSTTHTFSVTDIPSFQMTNMSGELTVYMVNNASNSSNVTMIGITRSANTFPAGGTVWYQRIGNFTSVTVTAPVNGTSVIITVNPASECRWVYRGF